VLLAVALPGIAGCSPAQGYDASLPPRASVSSNTANAGVAMSGPQATGVEAEVLAGYRSYWDALVTAGATADDASPLLPAHATSIALKEARAHFGELKRLGQVDRGTVTLHPRVVTVKDRRATVKDCPDTSHWVRQDAKTGASQGTRGYRSTTHIIILLFVDQAWKAAVIIGKGPCES
jgi:hypothetical protein